MNKQKGEAELIAVLGIVAACVVIGWLLSDSVARRECAKGVPQVIGEKVFVCVERK